MKPKYGDKNEGKRRARKKNIYSGDNLNPQFRQKSAFFLTKCVPRLILNE